MKLRTLGILIVINVVYVVLGGVIFHFLEEDNEDDTRKLTGQVLEEFLAKHQCLTAEELQTVIKVVTSAYHSGISVSLDNSTSDSSNWDIPSSVSFATTVVTTIGYGYLSPSTTGGRVFCVLYALAGIPVCLTMLGVIGARLSQVMERVACRLQARLQAGRPAVEVLPPGESFAWRWFGWVFMMLIGAVVFVLVPSAVISVVEDWTYGEAFYFSIITLTTIGFGDYVLASDYDSTGRGVYRLLSALWIFLGLAWCATMIASTQDKLTAAIVVTSTTDDRTGVEGKDVEEEKMIPPKADNKSPTEGSPEHQAVEMDALPANNSRAEDNAEGQVQVARL